MRVVALLSLALLVSCGTPEYRAERQICTADWLQKIPPVYQQQIVTRYRTEERPTGVSVCTPSGNQQICRQQMRTIEIPYTAVETVDINESRRNPQIAACAARSCQAKFGNAECKTD
ncbi:MAG: hypothetical protein Q7J57_17350 [Gemmobacter sp.]|nr:hypothetical protein [Gemmobacter sp.]